MILHLKVSEMLGFSGSFVVTVTVLFCGPFLPLELKETSRFVYSPGFTFFLSGLAAVHPKEVFPPKILNTSPPLFEIT